MSDSLFTSLLDKLKEYKKKYYLNTLLKGAIFFFTLAASAFLIVSLFEYFGKYNSSIRFCLLVGYLILTIFGLLKWVIFPFAGLLSLTKQISDEEAAKEIGSFFPEVKDKLLNTLQLGSMGERENSFIQASISQKTKELSVVPFAKAVNLGENRRYLKYLALPLLLLVAILVFVPQILTESTARIINYEKTYTYPAPFQFILQNDSLKAYKNEDFQVNVSVKGKAIPEDIYLYFNGRKAKMKKNGTNGFSFAFQNLQKDESFQFEAAGYNSQEYLLKVMSRPDLKLFDVDLHFPAYLKKKNEAVSNAGNLTVPEGTIISWKFQTQDVDKIHLTFLDSSTSTKTLSSTNDRFSFSKKLLNSVNYKLELENESGRGNEKIGYHINVVKDQYPQLHVEHKKDTILYNYIAFGGTASDDYGLTTLKLFYRLSEKEKYKSVPVPIRSGQTTENFFYNWNIDTISLKPGEKISYYLQIWDNDGVNGYKSSKSSVYDFSIPEQKEIKEELKSASQAAENKISSLHNKSKKLNKELDKFEEKLKTKKELDWQDKKSLEELLKKHEELKEEIEHMQSEQKQLDEKLKKFNQPDPEIVQKMEQLQKLMDELMDEETKKLYEELQKMLQENAKKEDIQKLLEEMKEKDQNMENELERTLEWFKQLQFDQKLDAIKKDLDQLSNEQEKLSDKTLEKDSKNEDLIKEQEKLNEDFKDLEKDLKDLKEMNESLENKKEMEDVSGDQQEIKENQQKSSEQLQNKQNKKAGGSQKDAAEKMEQLSEKLAQMQTEMNQEQMEENMEDLRAILENLLKLSFDQEELMKDFRRVNQTDPRYLELSQKQLKLKDDSKIIEDSLMALAKRVFQIQSFITRELGEMNEHMDGSIKNIRDRRPDLASGNQQFSMTSINNLALLLNDVLKQMQQEMAQMSGGGQMCKKPGNNKKPGLGDLQKQLNEQMGKMKNGMKPGESMSKELAKMAAQQEMIRNALKDLQKKSGGDKAGKELSEIMKEMEKSEKDLVNKRINQDLIMRQKEILTRLLEAENSLRERDTEEKRESNTGKELPGSIPPDLEKYLREKEKQTELLKTTNPSFTPYYKKEVNEYFQKIEK